MSLVTVLKCIPAGDPDSRRSFAWSEDRGPRRTVRSAASAATREAMLNALARGDSGLRASIGARAAWPAPPPTACTQPHRGRPSPRDPGAGACGATHSLQPWAQGIMASQPPTPGWWQPRGPDGWSALGVWGPSVFQAPCPWPLLPGTSVTSALQTSRCSHRGRGSLCPAKPLSGSTAPEWKQLHRERPASARVSEAAMDHRGAAWAQPCPCPQPLPPPPPWLPLHLGEERAVRAPALATGGQPQSCGVVRPSARRNRTRPSKRPPTPFSRLTVVAGDPKQRDAAQAAQPGSPSVTRTRAHHPPLARTLIHPEGGQCPLLRPPRAPAGRREGRGRGLDWPREPRTRRRSSGRRVGSYAAPCHPPCPPGKALLPWCPAGPAE